MMSELTRLPTLLVSRARMFFVALLNGATGFRRSDSIASLEVSRYRRRSGTSAAGVARHRSRTAGKPEAGVPLEPSQAGAPNEATARDAREHRGPTCPN